MYQNTARLRSLGVLLIILSMTLCGCKKKQDGSGSDSAIPARVELSNMEVEVLSPFSWRISVKYRFVKGKPTPGTWYHVFGSFRHGPGKGGLAILSEVDGKDLQTEGVLQNQLGCVKPFERGDVVTLELEMKQGPQKRSYEKTISNVLKGQSPAY
jgi:hypothetical protein